MDTKVLIAVPTAEYARHGSFYDFFNQLDKPVGTGIMFARGQSPARNRNLMIEQAINHGFTHILFIDDDVIVRPDLLTRLIKHNVDIVSGLYLMRNYPHQPIIFNYADELGRCKNYYPKDGESGLIEIVAAGLGACLIKVEALKKIPAPWVTLGELEKDHWCDDIAFFKKVREAGIKIHCDLDAVCGHIASAAVWPSQINNEWQTVYDTFGKGQVSFPALRATNA